MVGSVVLIMTTMAVLQNVCLPTVEQSMFSQVRGVCLLRLLVVMVR